MKLSRFLSDRKIYLDIPGNNKEEVIKNILFRLASDNDEIEGQSKEILESIIKREENISTALGRGIVMPHCKIEGIKDIIVAIGITKKPIDVRVGLTDNRDNGRVFIVVISNPFKNKDTLKVMSSFIKLSKLEDTLSYEKLKGKNSQEIYNYIEEMENRIDPRIFAEDLVNEKVVPIKEDELLIDVVKDFILEETSVIPVIDRNNRLLGEVGEREILEYGMPKYASAMINVSFIREKEPFEGISEKRYDVTIKDIYKKEGFITLDRRASLMEVCFHLVYKNAQRVYVVDANGYYGMILRKDILKKVLHI